MFAILVSAALIASSPTDEVQAANNNAASTAQLSEELVVRAGDPAQQINRGIALARLGDMNAARELFIAARDNREWIDLQIPSGHWVDSRSLARRALVMLKHGDFGPRGQIALR
ncbi:hypothetical protein GRI58_14035 [Porphyrobacter algicida]|uniref:Tetratricopeptide repeat protein n=1 Tax=Qipengyuania algicida TaxID=1836209 RepID=A0A845ASS5_9SPHN|nr:hypothetical protein [Qipengyuania algicida]MXP29928.1 hypothetical protein [Qipengyuania algicida]